MARRQSTPCRLGWLLAGVFAGSLSLMACDSSDELPAPRVASNGQVPDDTATPAVPSRPDPSVPSATAALPSGDAIPPATEDTAPGVRSEVDSSMSNREAATAMPLPGQANDHSAPVNDAKQPDRGVTQDARQR